MPQSGSKMVYLDVCCLNRPFDDQSQDRIRLESEAVIIVLSFCESGNWQLVVSDVVDYEISRIPDPERKERIMAYTDLAHDCIELNNNIKRRALKLTQIGFKPYDALHIACAESANIDVFLTTDDKLLSLARRSKEELVVEVINPLIWLMEVM
ncbi:MAG: PIN domain-containing protein [Bacillota bacterium]|nr:PIN domain-containing protein [Bacillota bacterium]